MHACTCEFQDLYRCTHSPLNASIKSRRRDLCTCIQVSTTRPRRDSVLHVFLLFLFFSSFEPSRIFLFVYAFFSQTLQSRRQNLCVCTQVKDDETEELVLASFCFFWSLSLFSCFLFVFSLFLIFVLNECSRLIPHYFSIITIIVFFESCQLFPIVHQPISCLAENQPDINVK